MSQNRKNPEIPGYYYDNVTKRYYAKLSESEINYASNSLSRPAGSVQDSNKNITNCINNSFQHVNNTKNLKRKRKRKIISKFNHDSGSSLTDVYRESDQIININIPISKNLIYDLQKLINDSRNQLSSSQFDKIKENSFENGYSSQIDKIKENSFENNYPSQIELSNNSPLSVYQRMKNSETCKTITEQKKKFIHSDQLNYLNYVYPIYYFYEQKQKMELPIPIDYIRGYCRYVINHFINGKYSNSEQNYRSNNLPMSTIKFISYTMDNLNLVYSSDGKNINPYNSSRLTKNNFNLLTITEQRKFYPIMPICTYQYKDRIIGICPFFIKNNQTNEKEELPTFFVAHGLSTGFDLETFNISKNHLFPPTCRNFISGYIRSFFANNSIIERELGYGTLKFNYLCAIFNTPNRYRHLDFTFPYSLPSINSSVLVDDIVFSKDNNLLSYATFIFNGIEGLIKCFDIFRYPCSGQYSFNSKTTVPRVMAIADGILYLSGIFKTCQSIIYINENISRDNSEDENPNITLNDNDNFISNNISSSKFWPSKPNIRKFIRVGGTKKRTVTAACFSPDGSFLIAAYSSKTIVAYGIFENSTTYLAQVAAEIQIPHKITCIRPVPISYKDFNNFEEQYKTETAPHVNVFSNRDMYFVFTCVNQSTHLLRFSHLVSDILLKPKRVFHIVCQYKHLVFENVKLCLPSSNCIAVSSNGIVALVQTYTKPVASFQVFKADDQSKSYTQEFQPHIQDSFFDGSIMELETQDQKYSRVELYSVFTGEPYLLPYKDFESITNCEFIGEVLDMKWTDNDAYNDGYLFIRTQFGVFYWGK